MSATTTTTYTRPSEVKINNREAWLLAAADRLWNDVTAAGGERPKNFRVSCGWPSKSALRTASSRSRRIGEAWHSEASEDQAREVFISPALADEVEVMAVLLHEMIHAALPADAGHGPAFQAIMRKVRLGGKPTATVPTEELTEDLRVAAHELGRYPHEKLDSTPRAKKPGRMVKGYCPDCGNILYGSRAAWDNAIPSCSVCNATYVVDPSPEQAAAWGISPAAEAETLENVTTMIELRTKDGRFTLRTTKSGGREGHWTVTDHEAIEVGTREAVGVELTTFEPRWTYRQNRADALAFIAAIREGDVTWDDVELADDEDEDFDEVDLGELGDWTADDDDLDLAEDEEEEPDYEDGHISEDEEAAYERITALREASGEAKSRQIATGGEGAMD